MPSYFEITISSRQLALVLAGVVALLLVAFGLGVAVGIQEPVAAVPSASGFVAVAAEPTFVPSSTVQSAPGVVDVLRGEGPAASVSSTPGVAEARPAQEEMQAVATAVPEPAPTEPPPPWPTAVPTALPTRPPLVPTATELPLPRLGRGVWVQVGALTSEAGAQNLRRRVLQLGYTPVQVVVQFGNDGKYRVRVGPFPDDESAGRVVARLRADGFPGAFTVKE